MSVRLRIVAETLGLVLGGIGLGLALAPLVPADGLLWRATGAMLLGSALLAGSRP